MNVFLNYHQNRNIVNNGNEFIALEEKFIFKESILSLKKPLLPIKKLEIIGGEKKTKKHIHSQKKRDIVHIV